MNFDAKLMKKRAKKRVESLIFKIIHEKAELAETRVLLQNFSVF